MAIQFTHNVSGIGTNINFGDVAAMNGLTNISIVCWAYLTQNTSGATYSLCAKNSLALTSGYAFSMINTGTGSCLILDANWSTQTGEWRTAFGTIALNTKYQVAFTYNASSTANAPLFYINGVSMAVTLDQAPTGAWSSGGGNNFLVGANPANGGGFNGKLEDIRFYNRILSSVEISNLYSSGSPSNLMNNDSGLVFHAPLFYSQNRYPTIPFASNMGNTDFTYDRMAGVVGTPANTPSGVADFVYGSSF